MRFTSIVALVLLLLTATVRSQSPTATIEGVVLDQQGGSISGAVVRLSGTSINNEIRTDANGRFRFDSVPRTANMDIALAVLARGFAQFERRLDFRTDDVAQLRLVLAPVSISEQVTVTATRTATRISETAASMASLGPEELTTTAALTLDDALRQVPGFSLFRR